MPMPDPNLGVGATLKTVESVKGGEMLMQALDLVDSEIAAINEWNQLQQQLAKNPTSTSTKSQKKPMVRQKNVLLLNLSPYRYMVRSLRMVKAPDLEQALLVMPFHYIKRFVSMLLQVIYLCFHAVVFVPSPVIGSSYLSSLFISSSWLVADWI